MKIKMQWKFFYFMAPWVSTFYFSFHFCQTPWSKLYVHYPHHQLLPNHLLPSSCPYHSARSFDQVGQFLSPLHSGWVFMSFHVVDHLLTKVSFLCGCYPQQGGGNIIVIRPSSQAPFSYRLWFWGHYSCSMLVSLASISLSNQMCRGFAS